MKANMGSTDRLIRIMIAVIIIACYFLNLIAGWMAITGLIISAALILTGLTGFCPLYALLRISTSEKN